MMERRERNKRNATEVLHTEDEPQATGSHANAKDGAGKPKGTDKSKVDLEMILQEIQDFRHENKEHLDVIRGDINNANKRLGEAEDRIGAAEAKLEKMELIMRSVLKTQTENEQKLIDQEARTRRKNLRIFNVPENEEQGASMIIFTEKLFREKLKIPDSLELNIERAHRALAPKPASGQRPRSIVVQFLKYRTKEEILRKAWEKKEIYVNNQRIYFDHDYPTAILTCRKEYNEAKRALKEKKIRFQTPYPSKLRVFYEGDTRLYQTAHDATKDMHDRGFTVHVVPARQNPKELLDTDPWHIAGTRRSASPESSAGTTDIVSKLQSFRRQPPQ